MSLLMDALKKAEEAKKTHQPSLAPALVPVLEEEHGSSGLDQENWENSPLQISPKETTLPVEEEFLIEKDISSESITSSWQPWEGSEKANRPTQEDGQLSEVSEVKEGGTNMSLLMDALKKAEEAKKTHQQPSLAPALAPVLEEEHGSSGLDQENWENSPLQISPKETILPVEEEFLIEKDISSESITSSWQPWEGSEKANRPTQEDSQISEITEYSDEKIQDDAQASKTSSMNWDEQWLPEFSEDAITKKEVSSIVEPKETPIHASPSFTLRDWKSDSSTKIDESKNLTTGKNKSSSKENREEATIITDDEPFSTPFEKTLYSPPKKEPQETAQRILAANASSGTHQSKRLYGGLLLIILLVIGGGYYYYSTVIHQENPWLVTAEKSASFQSPFRKTPLENTTSRSLEDKTTPRLLPTEENKFMDRVQISKENQNDQTPSSPKKLENSKSMATEMEDSPVLDKKEEKEEPVKEEHIPIKGEQTPTEKKQSPPSDSDRLPPLTSRKLDGTPSSVQNSPPSASLPQKSGVTSSAGEMLTSSRSQASFPKKSKTPPLPQPSTDQEEVYHHKTFKNEVNKELSDAYMAFQRGDKRIAQQTYTKALEKDQNNRDALLGLAALAIQRGEPSIAQRHYQQILQLYPEDIHAQVGLITSLDYQSSGSEQLLKSLLGQAPQSSYIHFSLGNLYARQGRWAQAQRAYFDAYHYDSTKADYAYNLAISLDQLNQPMVALDYYQKALQLSKNQTINFSLPSVHRRIQTLLNYARRSTKNSQEMSQMK